MTLSSSRSHHWALVAIALLGLAAQSRGQEEAVEPVAVFDALGWPADRVDALLDRGGPSRRGGGPPRGLHVDLVLHDAEGKYLANRSVRVEWDGGGRDMPIDRSGVLHLDVDRDRRSGLKVLAPVPYTVLQQRSHSDLPGYAVAPGLPAIYSGLESGGLVVDDRNYRNLMGNGLNRLAASGAPTPAETLKAQRDSRTTCTLALPPVPPSTGAPAWTPSQVVAQWRDSVVIVGVYNGQGGRSEASGVVIADGGVIATNCHVIDAFDNPRALAGVVTRDGRFYPVVEVLAADPATDIAILRIGLDAGPAGAPLVPAPLSTGDFPGEPLTVISHPNGKFYWVSEGVLSRYAKEESLGRAIVVMSLTADYAVGSSGAPVFNAHGAVAGLAARTSNVGTQLVFKEGPPALAIRAMIHTP
jgi:hypothetical protein